MDRRIESFTLSAARDELGGPVRDIALRAQPLRGGLEAQAVSRITLRCRDHAGRARTLKFVAKRVAGAARREADVYRKLLSRADVRVAPHVFGIHETADEAALLILEDVRPAERWPWRATASSRILLERLAEFQLSRADMSSALPPWDYESVITTSAVSTLERVRRLRTNHEFVWLRRYLRPLDRFVAALPRRRSELLAVAPFGPLTLHGDLHPGNAIVRRRGDRTDPILLDWGRARTGSALEDVSSWLQTLSYWEPEVQRRHDTILVAHLSAFGYEHGLCSGLRGAYWTAAASNVLAGALRYYCDLAEFARTRRARASAAHLARYWLRVVERADAWGG